MIHSWELFIYFIVRHEIIGIESCKEKNGGIDWEELKSDNIWRILSIRDHPLNRENVPLN